MSALAVAGMIAVLDLAACIAARVEITPGLRRIKSCIPQKQPPARTARSVLVVMGFLQIARPAG
jgi:hypothetical protein